MLVSIIVPVYNVEKYLRQCLDSLRKQTYLNIEVIMVDDGSKDSSGKICDEYAEKYANFSVIHKENAGLGMARNTGLEVASGRYVYFFDSDDYIDSDEIECMMSEIMDNDADACLTGYQEVEDDGGCILSRAYTKEIYYGDDVRMKLLPRMLGSSPREKDSIEMAASGQIYSMDIIKKNGIKFCSERDLISEDLVFNIDYMQHAKCVCISDRNGYYYRMNPASLTHRYLENRFEQSKKFYVEISKRLKSLGYGDTAINRLRKSFFINVRAAIEQESQYSEHSYWDKRKKVISICNDEVLQNAIRSYPIQEFSLKQRVFLELIRYKCVFSLMLLLH